MEARRVSPQPSLEDLAPDKREVGSSTEPMN